MPEYMVVSLAGNAMAEELGLAKRSRADRDNALTVLHSVTGFIPWWQAKPKYDAAWNAARRLAKDRAFQEKCLGLSIELGRHGHYMTGQQVKEFLDGKRGAERDPMDIGRGALTAEDIRREFRRAPSPNDIWPKGKREHWGTFLPNGHEILAGGLVTVVG